MTEAFYHNFEETHRSESIKTGTAACRANIVIRHRDTLGHKLPAGITVKVYDQDGGVYYGNIDENGDSHHFGVKCGMISWQLMRGTNKSPQYQEEKDGRQLTDEDEQAFFDDSDGYVLIKANDEKTEDPRLQLAKPLQVFGRCSSSSQAWNWPRWGVS